MEIINNHNYTLSYLSLATLNLIIIGFTTIVNKANNYFIVFVEWNNEHVAYKSNNSVSVQLFFGYILF